MHFLFILEEYPVSCTFFTSYNQDESFSPFYVFLSFYNYGFMLRWCIFLMFCKVGVTNQHSWGEKR